MTFDYRQLSFWHDSLPAPMLARPTLDTDIEADVVIVGAGYTGLWTAYYLKQIVPALDIVVLEAEIAGFGASGRNGGWCSSHLSGIGRWLDDPVHKDGALRLQRLMFETVQEIGRVAQRESIDCHYERSGTFDIAVLPAQLIRLQAEWKYLQDLGLGDEDYSWFDAKDLSEVLNVNDALAAIRLHHCAAIHPARLARGLAECVAGLGVRIYEHSPVQDIVGHALTTPRAKVRAKTILITTEGYTAGLAGHRRRLIPVHSMMVATEPLSQQQVDECGFRQRYTFGNADRVVTYGQLTADGRIAFGCRGSYLFGSGIRHQFKMADSDFSLVRGTLLRFFPGLQGVRFTHAWGGAMGVSRSLRPTIKFDPDTRLGWAGGFFGSGVAATHLAGQTLADLVCDLDTERLDTPWVNPAHAERNWEPEPLRWLGIRSARALMSIADQLEYRGGVFAPFMAKTLDLLRPDL